jgi:phage tail-like protein
MANRANETVLFPFTNFNFAVEIEVTDISPMICNAAFSECDGLEMTMEVKTIREGGNNGQQIRFTGPISYGQLTLKRGMTSSFDLWNWFDAMVTNVRLRAQAEVVIFAADGQTKLTSFVLKNCIPTKLKAPMLSATDGKVAIEELQLAYESLKRKS